MAEALAKITVHKFEDPQDQVQENKFEGLGRRNEKRKLLFGIK